MSADIHTWLMIKWRYVEHSKNISSIESSIISSSQITDNNPEPSFTTNHTHQHAVHQNHRETDLASSTSQATAKATPRPDQSGAPQSRNSESFLRLGPACISIMWAVPTKNAERSNSIRAWSKAFASIIFNAKNGTAGPFTPTWCPADRRTSLFNTTSPLCRRAVRRRRRSLGYERTRARCVWAWKSEQAQWDGTAYMFSACQRNVTSGYQSHVFTTFTLNFKLCHDTFCYKLTKHLLKIALLRYSTFRAHSRIHGTGNNLSFGTRSKTRWQQQCLLNQIEILSMLGYIIYSNISIWR